MDNLYKANAIQKFVFSLDFYYVVAKLPSKFFSYKVMWKRLREGSYNCLCREIWQSGQLANQSDGGIGPNIPQ